jgi:hypothetical protein
MKNEKKKQTVGTIPKSNIKIIEEVKSIPLTHKYMTGQLTILAWFRHFNEKWQN